MAIRSVKDIKIARRIGMSWMLVSITGALATGLFGLAYVSKYSASISDPETIFIFLSQLLFHPLISGFLLGAILAAIMSTISSQLLVTSSSLTGDIYQIFLRKSASQKELVVAGRVSVLIVALFALYLAHDKNSSILSLVSSAWAGFGAAFGPVILLSLYWSRMTRKGAICGMLVGAITVIVWSYGSFTINEQALSAWLYEIVPGFIACTLTIIAVSLVDKQPAKQLTDTYQQVVESLQSELTSK
jgi:SSS family solute:Na+ symporter